MILKNYEINKIEFNSQKSLLFYGENEGHKNEIINKIIGKKKNILNYEEKEILENTDNFIENLNTKSLFEKQNHIN